MIKVVFLVRKVFIKILFCNPYFSSFDTVMGKRKDPDPGGLKTYGSYGSGSRTLGETLRSCSVLDCHMVGTRALHPTGAPH
jgi:hypothetical protein